MGKNAKPVVEKHEEESEEEQEEQEESEEEVDVVAEFLESLPADIRERTTYLLGQQEQFDAIDVEYKKERAALEKKYFQQKLTIWADRSQVISGAKEVIKEGTAAESKGIPGFWLQCLVNNTLVGQTITEEDMGALKSLSDIKVEYSDDYTTFSIHFHFDENEFFTNKILSKKYTVSPDVLDEKAPSLEDTEGTEIDWKPNMNLCHAEIKKKQRAKSGKNKGQTRVVVQSVPKPSFFHYFSNPLTDEELENQDEEEENPDHQVRLTAEEDYEIGHTIRTTIVPDAIGWFTGELVDEDYDMDEEDEEGEEEDDEEDDDEDEDEEEEEEEKPTKQGKKGKNKPAQSAGAGFAGAQGGQAGGNNPECKQN